MKFIKLNACQNYHCGNVIRTGLMTIMMLYKTNIYWYSLKTTVSNKLCFQTMSECIDTVALYLTASVNRYEFISVCVCACLCVCLGTAAGHWGADRSMAAVPGSAFTEIICQKHSTTLPHRQQPGQHHQHWAGPAQSQLSGECTSWVLVCASSGPPHGRLSPHWLFT